MCPRHPDRESWVRCQRCERPTCPECQRPAAVGIQCVDCVREGQRGVRQARTTFGGVPTTGRPAVTTALIAACVVLFLLQLSVPGVSERLAYRPFLTIAEPERLLTAAFLHSPGFLLHIAFNMYALWAVGGYLEHLLGRARFLAVYLISALGGSVGYLLLATPAFEGSWTQPVVGASGAVFGLFGALVVLHRRLGRSSGPMLATIGINAVLGFVAPQIAWEAHLGGLVTGALCAAVVAYAPRRGRTAVQAAGLVGVLVLVLAAALVKIGTTPSVFFVL